MIRHHCTLFGFAALLVIILATPALAEDRPVQLALFTPVQIFPETDAITGIRLNLLYGRNTSVSGLDLGLINHTTTGASVGLQYGLVNLVDSGFTGWQDSAVNLVRGDFKGLQTGLVNHAHYAEGLQLGLVNYAESMHGLQIGIANIIRRDGMLPFFPIVNWSF